MGRKKTASFEAHVRLPESWRPLLDDLSDEGESISTFVRQAVSAELERRKRERHALAKA